MVTNRYNQSMRARLTISGHYVTYQCGPYAQIMIPSPFYIENGVRAYLFAEWLDDTGKVIAIASEDFSPYRHHGSYTWSYDWQPYQEQCR